MNRAMFVKVHETVFFFIKSSMPVNLDTLLGVLATS